MKKLLLVFAFLLSVFVMQGRDNYTHDVSKLPVAARTVLKNNFKAGVSHIKIEKDLGRVSEYEVVLNDGTEITFDKDGNWKEIEVSSQKSIPKNFVPQVISDYVKKAQKNAKITGIEKSRKGFEVELSNGVEMKFDTKGNFLRYAD